jgi:hypothetical protein
MAEAFDLKNHLRKAIHLVTEVVNPAVAGCHRIFYLVVLKIVHDLIERIPHESQQ